MRRRAVLLFGALSILASGCGIASQRSASPLPASLRLGAAKTTTTLPSQIPTNLLSVYFLKNGRLSPVTAYYSTSADALIVALAVLSQGPSSQQTHAGMTTAFTEFPAKIQIAGTFIKGKPANVEVDTNFLNLPATSLEEASAQIVYTLTGLPDAPSSVRFVLDGQFLESLIPPSPGTLVNRAVTRLDYCQFAPVNYTPCIRASLSR